MEYNSGSNRSSNFKSAERVAQGQFKITSNNKMREYTIYLNFFSRVLNSMRIYFISVANSGKTIKHRKWGCEELIKIEYFIIDAITSKTISVVIIKKIK